MEIENLFTMLSIRFLRVGKKHQPSYKMVVVEKSRSPKSGKFVEQVGFYNPITKEKTIKAERVKYWLSKGAQPSDILHNLFVKQGILAGKKIAVHSKKKKGKEQAPKPKEAEAVKEDKLEEKKTEAPEAAPAAQNEAAQS